MTDAQAAYALARARMELRLTELRAALERQERDRRWDRVGDLETVERWLARLVEEVERR